jgi:hypothetical protein
MKRWLKPLLLATPAWAAGREASMRTFLISALVMATPAWAAGPMSPDSQTDKYAHFGLSCVMTASVETIGKGFDEEHHVTATNRFVASSMALAIGAIKEARDMRAGGEPAESRRDVLADLLGIAVGNLIHWEF